MKRINILLACSALLFGSCADGYIDQINTVDPGTDENAPEITVEYPLEGALIRVREDVTPINIQFTVTDDIEIGKIKVTLNGNVIGEFDDFIDYRKTTNTVRYDQLATGEHKLVITATDLSGKTTDKTVNFEKVEPYNPIYDGEVFYMPFDGDNMELVSIVEATRVGNPRFSSSGKVGSAYAGATDSYLTISSDGLTNPNFSAAFWYRLNATPDRGGILVMGPPDEAAPTSQNNRTKGFRLFRENNGGLQRITLNVGNGTADSWFNSADAFRLQPTSTDWVHVAFTISSTEAVLYVNGELAAQGSFTGVDWEGCDILSIGSGAPRFSGWNHLSDLSNIDELRIFDKVLSQTEIRSIITAEQ